MPLQTRFTRADGRVVALRWGQWHLAVFEDAARAELEWPYKKDEALYQEALQHSEKPGIYDQQAADWYWEHSFRKKWQETGRYVFQQEHIYKDPEDGEVLHIFPGDYYQEWR